MKTTFYALAACLGLGTFTVQAQDQRMAAADNGNNALKGKQCATMEVFQAQLAADPSLAQRMATIENQTQQFEANPAAHRTSATVIIPVVVHVVYNTAAQNISDAQVQSQIAVLNEDFRKLNADRTKVPAAFAGLAADVNVQFVLAKRTPTGAATNGIDRVQTKTASWSTNDAVKNAKRGGANAWDATKYLNLWACNLGQGLLGYAQFPGGSASTDGVVILYSAFGSRAKSAGTYTSTYDLGRTATHEVGHWLNLRHIWGDASCGNDLVSDTPTQQTSNYGCPAYPHVTCSNQGDMSMNYMDYTDDACMYMFSTGQSTRMNALFAAGGARAGLVTSLGGTAPRTALASLGTAAEVAMYPNPASNVLNLTLPQNIGSSVWNVAVYDLRGHEMKQAVYNGQGQVNVAQLPKGLYQMTISNGEQTTRQRFQKD
jgi:hypothetical protein